MKLKSALIFLLIMIFSSAMGQWPAYKGNLYFTANNDELVVKRQDIKWQFEASSRLFYPAVSDHKIYVLDQASTLYCLDEETGALIFKSPLPQVMGRFRSASRVSGKVKAPLIQGGVVVVTGADMIYAFDKNTGQPLWARPGVNENAVAASASLDGIYSIPLIVGDTVFYGTRNSFMARNLKNGHVVWQNDDIKSWNGFPGFYGETLLVQSRDYRKNETRLYALNAKDGKILWSQKLETPLEILPPAVFDEKVYLPSSKNLMCLDLKTGAVLWVKAYDFLITSPLSFTEGQILFTADNSFVAVASPVNGSLIKTLELPAKSGPFTVLVRDQIYIAYNDFSDQPKDQSVGRIKALNFEDQSILWEFSASDTGAVSQPMASGGILFFPAGKTLYALGEPPVFPRLIVRKDSDPIQKKQAEPEKDPRREIKLALTDDQGKKIPATVEVIRRENGKETYRSTERLDDSGKLKVPSGEVEILASSEGFLPKKITFKDDETEKKLMLDKLETEKPLSMDQIYFETNQAYLKKESLDLLDGLVKILSQNPALKVEIRGHTDSTGAADYNKKLSLRRANAVSDYLIKQGILPERLKTAGFGKERPVASNDTEEGRAKNRRTEFYFTR